MAKIKEETAEVEEVLADAGAAFPGDPDVAGAGEPVADGHHEKLVWEVGDLLFAVVNLARKLRVDPELALRGSALRFRERVEGAATAAADDGLAFENMSLDDQETYYQRAKKELKR
jgi:uncharacterized protein YabN with tetrapyrrole methylase and pyrophosphatase domain